MANKPDPNVITFGTYEGCPIEWIKIQEENKMVLLVSKYSLFSAPFNSNYSDGYWSISTIRTFLNKKFFNESFTNEEKKQIVNVKLTDVNNCKDDIFLLSVEQIRNLLTQQQQSDILRLKQGNTITSNSDLCYTRTYASRNSNYPVWGLQRDNSTFDDSTGSYPHYICPALWIRKQYYLEKCPPSHKRNKRNSSKNQQQPVGKQVKEAVKTVEAATETKAGLVSLNRRKQKAKKREVKYSTLSNMFGL